MPITLYNNWRLEVLEAIHSWPNRYVITGASTGSGTFDPIVGQVQMVDGDAWVLDAQHQPPGEDWTSSAMKTEVVSGKEHVNLHLIIGAEDPLPTEDYKDIRLSAIFLGGSMIEVPYRPYAVRTTDLGQMPDGIFETKLGTYYMGVRIRNVWGIPFSADNVVDITPESRNSLSAQGIYILDDWSVAELNMLGQQVTAHGITIGHLNPGGTKTIFFKVDVSAAQGKKYDVKFICRNVVDMSDPDHSGRKFQQHFFVSKTEYNVGDNSFSVDLPQGTLQLHIDEVAIDEKGLKESVKKAESSRGTHPTGCSKEHLKELQVLLKKLLAGDEVDLCQAKDLLACCCNSHGSGGRKIPVYDPYYLILTKMRLIISPKAPYSGQFGRIPYDDPAWWKVLLAIIAAILALIGGAEEAGQSAYEDEDLVIGELDDFERHQLDAALCRIDTSRELKFRNVLDAQSDEDNQTTVIPDNLDGLIQVTGDIMSREEIDELMAEAEETEDMSILRVFKSGGRTGTTIAQIGGWNGPWERCDLKPDDDCDGAPEHISRFDDEERPTIWFEAEENGDPNNLISNRGDSGSVWIHFDSKRPIALHHSGNPDANTGIGSLLEYIVDRFNITF